jgi:hypothetical protein
MENRILTHTNAYQQISTNINTYQRISININTYIRKYPQASIHTYKYEWKSRRSMSMERIKKYQPIQRSKYQQISTTNTLRWASCSSKWIQTMWKLFENALHGPQKLPAKRWNNQLKRWVNTYQQVTIHINIYQYISTSMFKFKQISKHINKYQLISMHINKYQYIYISNYIQI